MIVFEQWSVMQYLRSSLRKNQMMHNTQRDGVSVTCKSFHYSLI